MPTLIPDLDAKLEAIDPALYFTCRLVPVIADGKFLAVVNGRVFLECDSAAEALEAIATVCGELASRFAPESIKV